MKKGVKFVKISLIIIICMIFLIAPVSAGWFTDLGNFLKNLFGIEKENVSDSMNVKIGGLYYEGGLEDGSYGKTCNNNDDCAICKYCNKELIPPKCGYISKGSVDYPKCISPDKCDGKGNCVECFNNNECKSGICENGKCINGVKDAYCNKDTDCRACLFCNKAASPSKCDYIGKGIADIPKDDADNHYCMPPLICNGAGKCVECLDNDWCEYGVCENGRCVECISDSDCEPIVPGIKT